MSIGLARVTINAPQRRVDVALPEHVPLAELLPEVLRHAGEGLADDGERHGGWLLRRTDGAPLATGQGLLPQGVRDGEVLHLVPARAQWPELEYDDVVEAIADGARRRGSAWSGAATRAATLAGAGVLLAVGLFALLHAGTSWGLGASVGLGVALLLALAGVVASRAYGDATAGGALGGYALPYAFVGGALLVASGDPVGVIRPLAWMGAPELLVGSVALLLVALLGLVGVAAALRVFAAGVTAGLVGALAALAGFGLPAAGSAALLMSVLVCGIGVLPLLAIRLGKLPMPPITLPTGAAAEGFGAGDAGSADGARERPERGRVYAAVARTEELLTGMLTGHAVLATAAALVLVTAGGLAGPLLAAVSSVALLLRSRLFVTLRQRVPMVAAGLAGLAVLGVTVAARGGDAVLLGFTVGGVLLALLTVATGATYSRRPPSPYLGRAADVVDTLMVVSVVPVACAVLGLYARARGLLG
ncbi:type VII secretion integral membrane protein EccD [Micromonospora pattaloongensis]|uniref:Type VII secretion integral membrane protein EccD n=1 Tax=Micromonospora pattaloongensis TaxID=405436 RepID=A0A1H3HAV7_9ACTN|nr:type VII secretion integral membrane protein EccD [Micromonospora pattaloongensis]SDY12733.1 type VII secretion integral membrane protein EccD [Micromonospora pattaloongensis]